MAWERRRILVWGKTRPELGRNGRELVVAGGVFRDTGALARLCPIPVRLLEDDKLFRRFQWIEADVLKSTRDPRPESYHIRYDSIETLEWIPTQTGGHWDARAEWVLKPANVFASLEALQDAR